MKPPRRWGTQIYMWATQHMDICKGGRRGWFRVGRDPGERAGKRLVLHFDAAACRTGSVHAKAATVGRPRGYGASAARRTCSGLRLFVNFTAASNIQMNPRYRVIGIRKFAG